MKCLLSLLCLFFFNFGYSIEQSSHSSSSSHGAHSPQNTHHRREAFISPWLTGPLLSSGYAVIPKGKYEIEPYIFEIVYTGVYNKHWRPHATPNFYQTNVQIPLWFGITKNADINISPQFFYNTTQGVGSGGFGDLSFGFDYQLIGDQQQKNWLPQIKLSITETFPTGKYQKLDPKKYLTDSLGLGAYSTNLTLSCGKIFHLHGVHYLSSILTLTDVLSTRVHVRGLNAYRGDSSTRGKVYPGNLFRAIYGTEFTLTRNWAIATDIVASFYAKTKFRGQTELPAGFPSATQISISPAIEYNWSFHLGLIVGSWFTIAGRNDFRFASAVTAASFYYSF